MTEEQERARGWYDRSARAFAWQHFSDGHHYVAVGARSSAGAGLPFVPSAIVCECGASWTGPQVYVDELSLRAWEACARGHMEAEGPAGTLACALLTLADAYRTACEGSLRWSLGRAQPPSWPPREGLH